MRWKDGALSPVVSRVCADLKNGSSSSTPNGIHPDRHSNGSHIYHPPRSGTIIPNRIFVRGIDNKLNESGLRHVFSQHGAVKDVKIVVDRTGMSKGYGFVTFERQDDALKVLHEFNEICVEDQRLVIGQAFSKRQVSRHIQNGPVASMDTSMPLPVSRGSPHQTMSPGCPYTYHNGLAYVHCPSMSHAPPQWPQPVPAVMHPQSSQPIVYQQTAFHHYQCVPNQYQWNVIQTSSDPHVYSQPSGYVYRPADGGPVPPPLPVMEDTTPELAEHHFLHHDPGEQLQMCPSSRVHVKPKCHHHMSHKDYQYRPEATEPPDASMLLSSHLLM
ncbi:uncharacterized protein V6R79_008112 [Siganus canaliculatus]